MVVSVEIDAVLAQTSDGESHQLWWRQFLEVSLDCFICERSRRTTAVEFGEEYGVCTGPRDHPHPTAVRLAAFDTTVERERLVLRAVVDHWWAPFHDPKDQRDATPLSEPPWVRLYVRYRCAQTNKVHEHSIQSNLVRPSQLACKDCGAMLGVSTDAPRIRLLT
jgi:hypothetical protein